MITCKKMIDSLTLITESQYKCPPAVGEYYVCVCVYVYVYTV